MFSAFKILCLFFSLSLGCDLTSLYKDSDRITIVKESLLDYFESQFKKVCDEAYSKVRYLLPPANYYKKDIKKLFIEYGKPLNSLEDLETILKSFDYLKIQGFRLWKEEWEEHGNHTDLLFD